MALSERRRQSLGPAARDPRGPPGPHARVRRGDRLHVLAGAAVAAALAMMPRPAGPARPDEDRVHFEPGSVRSDAAAYDRDALDALIDEAAAVHGVSAHLVRAVVQAESAFDPAAVSPVGAQGLMQLMPTTAALMGVSDPLDPRQNVFGGVKYLSQLLDRFGGNVALALAGYNAGPTTVARYCGIPPYGETRGYVTRIRSLLAQSTGAFFPLPTPPVRQAHQSRRRRKQASRMAELRRAEDVRRARVTGCTRRT
jgi:soluble lytic murein transglycosylase-like protein